MITNINNYQDLKNNGPPQVSGAPTPPPPPKQSPPKKPVKMSFGCGGIPGKICGMVPNSKLCQDAKNRLKVIGPLTILGTIGGANKNLFNIPGGSVFSRGLGLVQLIISSEALADYVDQDIYCE